MRRHLTPNCVKQHLRSVTSCFFGEEPLGFGHEPQPRGLLRGLYGDAGLAKLAKVASKGIKRKKTHKRRAERAKRHF